MVAGARGRAAVGLALVILLSTCLPLASTAWSNGGWSADPDNPDYGTHDWMAQHALDWLPGPEKQYIIDNLAAYLYGTELPDLPSGSGGIGDTFYHHFYFYENGTIMFHEDDTAWRADTEYNDTMLLLEQNDLSEAAKNAGIMTHYIADASVWAHVMGSPTQDWWGVEDQQVHSDYESHVTGQTTDYNSTEWDPFLEFDGRLDIISAYNATYDVAWNSTFGDENGDFNCSWFNVTASGSNEWSNTDFVNRTGVLLNIAVNAIADVLHTLAIESGYAAGNVEIVGVKVNEFEQNPLGQDAGFEWVELYNPTSSSVDLSYWSLQNNDGDKWELPSGTSIDTGGYMVVVFPTQWLDNTNESVGLFTPYGTEVDLSPRCWDEDNDVRTWSRLPNGIDTNATGDWTFQAATRNQTNDPPPDRPPVPSFTVSPTSGDNTTVFTFDASASSDPDGDGLSFEWDWGDGTANSTGVNVTHVFTLPGSYNITLAVDDNNGSMNSTNMTLEVSPPPPPPDDPPLVTSLGAVPALPGFEDNITLVANCTDDLGVANLTFHFNSSLGAEAGTWRSLTLDSEPFEADIGRFPKNATVLFHVEVADTGGHVVRYPASGELAVNVTPNVPPVAALTTNRTRAMVNESLTFSAAGSFDDDGAIVEYIFDFGDCCLSGWTSNSSVDHAYSETGYYNATVTVKDSDADIAMSDIIVIHIDPRPRPNHAPTIRVLDIPDNITVNETLDLLLEVDDVDGDELSIILSEAPEGVVITVSNHLMWVPDEDQVGTHTIVLEVTDGVYTTVYDFSIVVKALQPTPPPPPPPPKKEDDLTWLWYSLLGVVILVAVLGTTAYLITRKKARFTIDDIFIVHDSGRLIAHVAKDMKPEAVDSDVVSSMLMAIQDFIKESLEMEGSLEVLKHGDSIIFLERGENHFTALVATGEPPSDLRSRLQSLNWTIEERYGKVLEDWDGALSSVKGVRKHLLPLIERYRSK